MSEKQFKLSSETVLQYQIMDNDTDLNESEVVDLLNKLYEENEELRQFINKGRRLSVKEIIDNTNENEKLKKENEQLKQKLENLGLNEKNDMVEYSIEDFFRWLQRIKKEFEDFEDRGF